MSVADTFTPAPAQPAAAAAPDADPTAPAQPVVAALAPLAAPFAIAVDDREKLPFAFTGLCADARQHRRPLLIPTVVRHLPTGDYTIDGPSPDGRPWAERVVLERKGLCDLFNTIGSHRERFERELERMAAMDFAAVVVEAEWSEIIRHPPPRSELPPKVVIRSVMAWQVRFPRVHWWTCPGRAVAESVTYRLLEKVWQNATTKKPDHGSESVR